MVSSSDRFDLIMIGAGLEGLLCAALLAKRGRRVYLMDESGEPGGASFRIQHKGYSFVQGPTLFLGFDRDGLYDRLFNELGISLARLKKDSSTLLRTRPPFQVVLPNHRVDYYNEAGKLQEELHREFPDQVREIRSLWREMEECDQALQSRLILTHPVRPATVKDWTDELKERWRFSSTVGSRKKIPAKEVIEKHRIGPDLRRILEILCLFFFQRSLEEASSLDLVYLIGIVRREMVTVNGGIPGLAPLLVKAIQESRGHVFLGQAASELVFRRRTLDGVRTARGEVIRANHVVVNRTWSPDGGDSGRTEFSLYFGVPERVIPEPMKNHLFLLKPNGQGKGGESTLYIRINPKVGKDGVPEGQRALQVTGFLDEEDRSRDEIRKDLVEEVKDQLGWLIPFSEGHLELLGEDIGESE
ncbi:MAG TPA: NAD(P)-binding protein, partial [Nitrospiria bacterium]